MERMQPYLEVLRRWWWFPLLCAVLAAAGGYLYTRQQRPVYAARVTLMVGSSLANPSPDPQEIGLSRTLAQVYGEMARRRPVLEETLKRLRLDLPADALARAVETRVVANASLLEIYVYDYDPERAAALANTLAQVLIEQTPAARTRADEPFLQSQLADVRSRLEDIDQRIQELRRRMGTLTSAAELREARDQLQTLEQLKRDYQQTYAQLITVMRQQGVNTLSLLEPALPPTRPVSPSVIRNVALAGGAGLLLSVAVLMALERFMGRAVRWDGSLTMFNLPVLGAVPRWRNRRDSLIIRAAPDSPEAEAIRSLRLRLLQALAYEEGFSAKVVLVTSPMPEDGKSFVASNLAAAAAEAGLHTVLVETDLRGGVVAHLSPHELKGGLVDYLEAEDPPDLDRLLILVDGGFTILPMGRIPRDPGLLLSSPRWRTLLDRLREHFALVILDAPPTLFLAELEVLARSADGVLLILRDGKTPRRLVGQARYALRGQRVLGVVVNDVPRRKLGIGYGYGYGYGGVRYPRAGSRGPAAPAPGWREGLLRGLSIGRARPPQSEEAVGPPAWPLLPRPVREQMARSLLRRPPTGASAAAASASEVPTPSSIPPISPMAPEPALEPASEPPPEGITPFIGVFALEEDAAGAAIGIPPASPEPPKAERPTTIPPFVEIDPELLAEIPDTLEPMEEPSSSVKEPKAPQTAEG
ncbi:hypothetical protein [Thermoflexus sp.]|uniref:hypothetical protein n=1 Tax=Thermoflexus sp. TaxID=1969742 RepID=UPI003324A6E2